jgi:DNA-binding NtrC family response regulator
MLATVQERSMASNYARPTEHAGRLHVLVVDEDEAVRSACCEIAADRGFVPSSVATIDEARSILAGRSVDILLIDLKAGSRTGNGAAQSIDAALKLLEEVKTQRPEMAIIAMTAFATVTSAVEAMRTGAVDYLTKPFSIEDFSTILQRAAGRRAVDEASRRLRERLRKQHGLGNIIGSSTEMEKLYRILSKVAHTAHPVLILGESGTGKELVARAIHANGPLAAKPFLPVDCGSLMPALIECELFGHAKGAFTGANRAKEGLLAAAEGGTLFLDEIGDLPLDLQAKLVRALQEKEICPVGSTQHIPINVRILAATHRDLVQMVEQGRFRKDLYYRLNVVSLRIPPLRERRGDIVPLAQYFLTHCNQRHTIQHTFSDEALRLMNDYPWPGNVRELENFIERACGLSASEVLQARDLSTELTDFQKQTLQAGIPVGEGQAPAPFAATVTPLAELERQAILRALHELKGDKLTTAKLLGIGKTTLYRKLKEYGISESSA